MKVLLTGSTGFIGTNLVKRLADMEVDLRLLVRSKAASAHWSSFKNIEIIEGDVTSYDSCLKATEGVHSVFHLAGLVGYSKAMHQAMVQVNVIGTQHLLDASIKNSIEKFVHMSSVTAIGASFDGKIPLTENSPYNLSHLNLGYFETKRRAEELVLQAAQRQEMFTLCLNPSTVYGPGDAQKGSRKTQLKVARGEFPFYTSGGVNVVHVDDVIHCFLEAWHSGRSGERYIVAGENLTIKQLFTFIANEAGVRPPPIYLPNFLVHSLGKFGDLLEKYDKKGPINSENAWTSTLFHWFDATKAKNELGLKPKPAELAIADSLRWIKDHNLLN